MTNAYLSILSYNSCHKFLADELHWSKKKFRFWLTRRCSRRHSQMQFLAHAQTFDRGEHLALPCSMPTVLATSLTTCTSNTVTLYKAVLRQARWTFKDWPYYMWNVRLVYQASLCWDWTKVQQNNSYLIFDAASRNKPWSNSIARSKAPSVISPEIISFKQ